MSESSDEPFLSEDQFNAHLQKWACEQPKLTTFRALIKLLHGNVKLGQMAYCISKPLDVSFTHQIYVKLFLKRENRDGTEVETYQMSIKTTTGWATDEVWFARLATAQARREKRPLGERKSVTEGHIQRLQRRWDVEMVSGWVLIRPPFPFLRLPMNVRSMVITLLVDRRAECRLEEHCWQRPSPFCCWPLRLRAVPSIFVASPSRPSPYYAPRDHKHHEDCEFKLYMQVNINDADILRQTMNYEGSTSCS